MTHEEKASWIRRGFVLFLALVIAAGVWFYPEKKPPVVKTETPEVTYDIEIYLYQVPANPECGQLAAILDRVGQKYERYVRVNYVDINQHPEIAKAEKVTRPPKVVMMAGETRACKFQGLWTEAQIERKVEEILRGLKRMGPDWRPEVKGMQPETTAAPALPVNPAPR